MYCSICGNALSTHLNYCNHCGARNVKNQSDSSSGPSGWVAISSALIAASGLFFAFSLIRVLLESRVDTSAIVVIIISYLIALTGMFTVFVRYMSRGSRSKDARPEIDTSQVYTPPPASFRRVNTAQLEPAVEPDSVTEHTTRTLDEVLVERK